MKAVVHLENGFLVKGFLDGSRMGVADGLPAQGSLPTSRIELEQITGKKVAVDLGSAKALFFVRSFEGNHEHHEIKFFQAEPDVEGLWVRLKFKDNEAIEGVVHNSLAFLTEPGFFLKPPDPESNNQLIYALKKSLREFYVLGLKSEF